VGVSADDNESHREFAEKYSLPFPLIADEDLEWANAFGVDTTLGMTNRDSFLIGPDGKVAKVYRGVDPGVHADEVLADAKALGGG
jgi:peroxiredoxin Q/BCP